MGFELILLNFQPPRMLMNHEDLQAYPKASFTRFHRDGLGFFFVAAQSVKDHAKRNEFQYLVDVRW